MKTSGARIAIKAHTYRDRPGFLVYGRSSCGHDGIRIFAKTRTGAEEIKAALKSNCSTSADRDRINSTVDAILLAGR